MKKTKYFVLILSLFFTSNLFSALVRVRNISQKGRGSIGKISIDLGNESYSLSNVHKKYTEDSVNILLDKTFITPIRRVFKSSSDKSSVAIIIASQQIGNKTLISIKFRIPIEIISQEDKIIKDKNKIVYIYNTKPKIIRPISTINSQEPIKNNEDTNIKSPIIKKAVEYNMKKIAKREQVKPIRVTSSIQNNNSYFSFTKLLILIIIISLIIFFSITIYSIRKVMIYNKMELRKIEDEYGIIKIVDKLRLGFTKKLFVIEVEQKRLLIATYKNKINLISNLGQVYYEEDNIDKAQDNTNLFENFKDSTEPIIEEKFDSFKTRLK